MSRKGAPKLPRITEAQVFRLLQAGVYRVCRLTGQVTGPRGCVLTPFYKPKASGRAFVRLYGFGGVRVVPRARLAWMAGSGVRLPAGWEVDHWDDDPSNDAYENLVALYKEDHKKIHRLRPAAHDRAADESVPF